MSRDEETFPCDSDIREFETSSFDSIVQIIIVAKDGSASHYLEFFQEQGVSCLHIESFDAMAELLRREPAHGIVVDLKTKLRDRSKDPDLIRRVLDLFPVAYAKEKGGEVSVLFRAQGGQGANLRSFLDACRASPPRRIRTHKRFTINLCVLIAGSSSPPREEERTITIDVSRSGMFLFTTGDYQPKDRLMISLPGLFDGELVEVVVRRVFPWGLHDKTPGIGVEFIGLDDEGREQILDLCHGVASHHVFEESK